LTKAAFALKVRIKKGFPIREISRVEEDEDVSVIIIGWQGTGKRKKRDTTRQPHKPAACPV
jgi:hypothetical protein